MSSLVTPVSDISRSGLVRWIAARSRSLTSLGFSALDDRVGFLDKLRNTGARGLFCAERLRNPISAVHSGSIHIAPGVRGTGTTGDERPASENSLKSSRLFASEIPEPARQA